MSKLADRTICPDCRAPLDPDATCTGCGLVLQGTDADVVWQLLSRADQLVEGSRLARIPVLVPADPAPSPLSPAFPAYAASAPRQPKAPRAQVSAPAVLLSLGGLCLLVASIVFVAVRWGSLGLIGRTTVLIVVTALFAAGATALTRRGLRGGAETVWLLTSALVSIDILAAYDAGLLGLDNLDGRHVWGLLGVVLLGLGAGVASWAASTPTRALGGMIGVASIGLLALTSAEAWSHTPATVASAVAVPLLAGLAVPFVGARTGRLDALGYVSAALAAISWFIVFAEGVDRASVVTGAQWWQDVRCWPLAVAGLYAAVTTSWGRLPDSVRFVAAGWALICGTILSVGGNSAVPVEVHVVTACGVALALAVVSAYGSRIWSLPAAALAGIGASVAAGTALVRPVATLENLPSPVPGSSWTLDAWTAPVLAATAALTVLGLLRHLPDQARGVARGALYAVAPVLVAIGGVTVYLESSPRQAPAVIAWTALLVLVTAMAVALRIRPGADVAGLVAGGYLVAIGLALASPSHTITATFATLLCVGLTILAAGADTGRLEHALVPVLAGSAAGAAYLAATQWPYVADAGADTAGLTLVAVAATVGLGASRVARTGTSRIVLECSALLAGLIATALPTDRGVITLVVTLAGAAAALVSITNRDRDVVAWLSTGLLGVATVMRIDDGASAPEVYSVPVALVLLVAGYVRLLRDDQVSSWRALGSGLSLGLVPSLLLALDEPVSPRGALIGAAGLAVLAAGAHRRWGAPFLSGAAVVAILAVRHLTPIAAALPRWITLGSVGLVLLLVGITWEARRRNAADAERYLVALR